MNGREEREGDLEEGGRAGEQSNKFYGGERRIIRW
jgi:hypothetical protein